MLALTRYFFLAESSQDAWCPASREKMLYGAHYGTTAGLGKILILAVLYQNAGEMDRVRRRI